MSELGERLLLPGQYAPHLRSPPTRVNYRGRRSAPIDTGDTIEPITSLRAYPCGACDGDCVRSTPGSTLVPSRTIVTTLGSKNTSGNASSDVPPLSSTSV